MKENCLNIKILKLYIDFIVLKISLKDILFFIFNKKLEEFCFYISFLHVSITLHKIQKKFSIFISFL